MIRVNRFRGLLMCAALVGAVAVPGMAEMDTKSSVPATYSSPKVFADHVRSHGGRINFVFGADRPFAECHASSIVQAANGTYTAVWFAGTKEKDPDVGIWYSRLVGDRWQAPSLLIKVDETAHWNPVLFRDEKGVIHLFFKVGPEIPHWQTYWMTSDDHGKSWSAARELVAGDFGGRGPVKNKPIILANGTWLAGASTEINGWRPFMDRSRDGGATWHRTGFIELDPMAIPGTGAIQPTLWESKPGYVHALMRTAMGRVVRSDSEDGGLTWTPAYVTDLPNNNSGVDALRLDDGRVLLLLNPVERNWGPRSPLTLAVSDDNGDTWRYLAHLETDEGEFSYPAMVETRRGVALSYTWKRDRVRFWEIPRAALD